MNITLGSSNAYCYGLYNNKPAYQDYYNKTIYVFKDISAKRIKTGNDFSRDNRYCKIVFVTNKQLLSMDYMEQVKNCVFDGKLGTQYRTDGCYGSYHFCLRKYDKKPVPIKM